MDSLSQIALGSAVAIGIMGRRTAAWKAALWGAVAGTLPDFDVVIDYGDPLRNMTFHRAQSHALFYLSLLSPLLAWLAYRFDARRADYMRWWLALWAALVTHPLLDAFTVYGTQLLLPFTDHPYGIGSIFIIDPLYTLPLVIGVIAALAGKHARLKWNTVGLAVSSAYLLWSVAAQSYVRGVVFDAPQARGKSGAQVLVTPTAFNTVLWRIAVMEGDGYYEGFYSLADRSRAIVFDRFSSDARLSNQLTTNWSATRLAWFTHGFYKLVERDGRVVMSDLRMGQEPHYTFSFSVAERMADGSLRPMTPAFEGSRGDVPTLLRWLWQRMWQGHLPPPRGDAATAMS